MIPAVIDRCAGIDVGKREVWVTRMVGPADQEPEVETRSYGTTTAALQELKQWLLEKGVTSVAMESTGSYWIPIHNVLCGSVQVVVGCSTHIKPLKGKKTDRKDSEWLAHLHRHGMIQGSFIPPKDQLQLRDFTRRRKKLLGNLCSEKNRIQKVLEVANVKIGNVVSNVFGVSGQGIVQALLEGKELEREEIAELAKGKLRGKVEELAETLHNHSMDEHHRWMIRQSVDHIVFVAQQIEELEGKIKQAIQPYQRQYELLNSIPGVKEDVAAVVLAEAGPDMSVFPTPPQLASWAGACPGNNLTGGKRRRAKIRKGNPFLMSALTQAVWGAVRTRGSVFQRRYYRLVKRLGEQKTIVAGCRSLLIVIHRVLSDARPYQEPDPAMMHEMEWNKQVKHHSKMLRKLGADEATVASLVEQMKTRRLDEPSQPPSKTSKARNCGVSRKPRPRRVGALGIRAY